jgi:hypothetical protein
MRASLIRTIVPWVVAWAGPVATEWFGLSSGELTTGATVLVGAGYYVGVRLAERYLSPKFGWLLGVAKQPEYPAKATGE